MVVCTIFNVTYGTFLDFIWTNYFLKKKTDYPLVFCHPCLKYFQEHFERFRGGRVKKTFQGRLLAKYNKNVLDINPQV